MRTLVQKEVVALIRFYEKRGWDWTCAAEFVLARHSGILDIVLKRPVRPYKYPEDQ